MAFRVPSSVASKAGIFQNFYRLVFNPLSSITRSISVDSRYFIQGSAEDIQLSRPVQLAGRKYLPGSFASGFPEQLSSPKEGFPLVLKARNNGELDGKGIQFWSECFKEQLPGLYENFRNGGAPVAVLIRGLPIKTSNDSSRFIEGLGFEFFSYKGGSGIRKQVDDFVLSGALDAPEYSVELHNDMSYSTVFPTKFVITCLKKSKFGGETGICSGRELTANLDADLKAKFERKGIRNLRCFVDKSEGTDCSWQRVLLTEDKNEAEKFLVANGYTFKWEGKTLVYWSDASPTITYPLTEEKLWFNQVHSCHASYFKAMPMYEGSDLADEKYPAHTIHADGDIIDPDDLDKVRRTGWSTAVGVSLEESDVLFLDNLAVLHSRLSFNGERVVTTANLY